MAVIDEHIFIDPTRTGRIGTNGGMNVCGKPAGNRLQILDNPRARPINIRPVFEDHEDVRIVKHGLGTHRLYLRRGQQSSDDWVGNLVFDDVRRLTLPVGVNDDLHV